MPSCGATGTPTHSSLVRNGRRPNEGLSLIFWIGPAIVRHKGRPAGPAWILIIRIGSELSIQLLVLGELAPVEPYAEAGPIRHPNGAVLVTELAAFDDIITQMMVVCVRCE